MEVLGLAIIFVVVVVFLTGFVLGNWFPLLRPFLTDDTDDTDETAEGTAPGDDVAASSEGVEPLETAAGQTATPPPAMPVRSTPPGLLEVLRVFRHERNYRLAVEIEEQLVQREQPFDADQHSRVALITADLADWLGLEFDIPARRPLPEVDLAVPQHDEDEEEQAPLEGMSLNPVKVVTNAMKANTALPPKGRDIAGEINAILQEQIEGTALDHRGIEISQLAGRGLRFMVGLTTYEFLDEIEDAEVQTAIRDAIRAWEGTQSD